MRRASIVVALVGLGVALASAEARADEDADAGEYARRSTTAFFSTELSPLPTVSGHAELDAALRFHRLGGLAVTVRLGVAYALSPIGGGDLFGTRVGIGLGWSFPLGRRLALTPAADVDMFAFWETGGVTGRAVYRATIELPISILLYRHVSLEPFVQTGVAFIHGAADVALVFGPRVGVVF